MTRKKHINTDQVCKDEFKKAEAHLEFNLVRDRKGNKNGFHRRSSSRMEGIKNVGPLLNGQGTAG